MTDLKGAAAMADANGAYISERFLREADPVMVRDEIVRWFDLYGTRHITIVPDGRESVESEVTPAIERLCVHLAHAYKWFVTAKDYKDPRWIKEFIRLYMTPDGIANHYTRGGITLDEMEWMLTQLGAE